MIVGRPSGSLEIFQLGDESFDSSRLKRWMKNDLRRFPYRLVVPDGIADRVR